MRSRSRRNQQYWRIARVDQLQARPPVLPASPAVPGRRAGVAANLQSLGCLSLKQVTLHTSLRTRGYEASAIGGLLSRLTTRTGQPGRVTQSSKGVARLGLRQGAVVGVKVHLHGGVREAWLERLQTTVRPLLPGVTALAPQHRDRRGNLRAVLPSIRAFPELTSRYAVYPQWAGTPLEVRLTFGSDPKTLRERQWLLVHSLTQG